MKTSRYQSEIVTLKKIEHRGRPIILMQFYNREDWLKKVKTIPGVRYTRTHGSYFLENNNKALEAFEALELPFIVYKQAQRNTTDTKGHAQGVLSAQHTPFIEAQKSASISGLTDKSTQSVTDISNANIGDIEVVLSNNHFIITLKYSKEHVKKIKKINKVWWDTKAKKWICRASLYNLEKLQEYFSCWRDTQYQEIETILLTIQKPSKVTLYALPDRKKEVFVEVSGFKKVISPIHKLTNRYYDKQLERWVIPYDTKVIQRLKEDYLQYDITVTDRLASTDTPYKPKPNSNKDRLRKLISKFKNDDQQSAYRISSRMMAERYSWSTISAYTVAVVKYNQWLGNKTKLDDTTQEHITNYTIFLSGQKLSSSYMNIQISALKYLFTKVYPKNSLDVRMIDRPKTRFRLPRILSQKEVLRMIEVTTNIKHRNILYAIYSSGLRLTELINLKIQDINYDRRQIIVRAGKGKKDRSVMLSDHLAEVLRAYFHQHKPVTYLFESFIPGKQYSTTSIQKVVKSAAKKAQITQKVTPHVLRHCFATHLHDRGISIASIQELLGHKDIKTTLIYTHISTQSLNNIVSPLDEMIQKKKP